MYPATKLVLDERKANEKRVRSISVPYVDQTDKKKIETSDAIAFSSDKIRAVGDATNILDGKPVDLARDLVTDYYGAEQAHHLPNDRSVDAMLDHSWIIRRSSSVGPV